MSVAEFKVEDPIKTNLSTPIRWVVSHLGHHKVLIFLQMLGAFGNAALAIVVPVMIGFAFNSALAGDWDGIQRAAILVVVSQITRSGLQFMRNFSAEIIGQRIERDAREELYTSLIGKSMTFHDSQPVGDTMARATNDVRELNLMVNPGFNLVVGSANFILLPIIYAPRYHPTLLLTPLLFAILYFLSLYRYVRTLTPIADRVRASFGKLNSRLAEAIDGVEVVKSSAQEEQEINRFRENAKVYRAAVIDQGKVEARYWPLLLLGLTIAGGFTHSILLFQQGIITVGDVIGYTGTLTLFGFPTFISLTAYSQVARGMAGARRILELINTETDLDENIKGIDRPIQGEVQFSNVSAGYLDGPDILHDITFAVQPGQTVAIVGQTGAGKSSLVKLLNRTYDARQGTATIDGVDVRDWNLSALRRQISIIEQDIFLFSRTIAENIAFGKPEASLDDIQTAARDAQAHDFIEGFTDGYQTTIGERGVTLSGGQRQRIALARAFLANPRILILDDSTSAVDSETEDKIQKAITRASERQTTFLITHRLSQIRWADQVVLLKNGRIEAVGNHDTLLADYPAYRQIFEQYDG